MESSVKDSRPSSPLFSLDEEETSEHLNEACLLSDTELPFDDRRSSYDFSNTVIPETPESPVTIRRKRLSKVTDNCNGAALYGPVSKRSDSKDMIPGYLHTTPSSRRTLKRRRLQDPVRGVSEVCSGNGTGFVPASSFLKEITWLESPLPSQSTVSSSTSTISCSSASPEHLLGAAAGRMFSKKTSRGCASEQNILKCNKEQRLKKTSTRISPGSCKCAAQERHVQDTERIRERVKEEVVIIDEDEDDVLVEATVRSIQMAEDEAFARSLQEQFDREEQLYQEQSGLQNTSPNRHQSNLPVDSYVGLSWISPWASMVQSASFTDLSPSRQPRQMRGGHNSRRRNGPYVPLDLLNDSQGNNYEALLAFEENQGSVMAKKTLSKEEIDRFPTKAYDPLHNAGKTDCQICFSDYKKGEKLRMLPCFHDYHVKCIDRWLKENATCPICRADVSL